MLVSKMIIVDVEWFQMHSESQRLSLEISWIDTGPGYVATCATDLIQMRCVLPKDQSNSTLDFESKYLPE